MAQILYAKRVDVLKSTIDAGNADAQDIEEYNSLVAANIEKLNKKVKNRTISILELKELHSLTDTTAEKI